MISNSLKARAMTQFKYLFLALVLWAVSTVEAAEPQQELYAPLSSAKAQSAVLDWVASRSVTDKQLLEQVGSLWANLPEGASAEEVFQTVFTSFALVDQSTKELLNYCELQSEVRSSDLWKKLTELKDGNVFFTSNVRAYVAEYLARRRMYDEALVLYGQVEIQKTVNPASALFYKAVCEHSLLQKTAGLKTVNSLLKNTEGVPVRYTEVARLMEHDFKSMKENSLNEVARKMSDVERRLDLGRGGQRVQKIEDEIIATLDEIIKKMEEQAGGGGGGGMGGAGNQPSGSGAADSSIKGSTAPGNVDSKKLSKKGGWGGLPPKAEARAKNIINRNFPAHYRQAVEMYFKKLATKRAKPRR